MVNDQGVADHKISFAIRDDAYSREDGRAGAPSDRGRPGRLPVPDAGDADQHGDPARGMKKVPHLFISTGADKWGDYQHFPWTMGYQPSYRTEAQIYTKYMLSQNPGAKLAILYQNDDFGKDYPAGVKDVLGDKYASVVAKEASYETTDATVDSQLAALRASGATSC
jgi:branched-chain amino acid transport system substrate-binding protein